MTRQHFVAIARLIAIKRQCFASQAGLIEFANALASYLQATNSRFDRARFIAACEQHSPKEARCAQS